MTFDRKFWLGLGAGVFGALALYQIGQIVTFLTSVNEPLPTAYATWRLGKKFPEALPVGSHLAYVNVDSGFWIVGSANPLAVNQWRAAFLARGWKESPTLLGFSATKGTAEVRIQPVRGQALTVLGVAAKGFPGLPFRVSHYFSECVLGRGKL